MSPLNTHAQTLPGTWTLTDYRARSDDGSNPLFPLGPNPRGIIIYTDAGSVAVHLMKPGAPHVNSPTPHDGPDDELAQAMRHSLAYAGSYTLQPMENNNECFIINHQVDVALFPNWVGGLQSRVGRFEHDGGERLVLEAQTKFPFQGTWYTSVLTWERATKRPVLG
ncbi:hypothetical protein BO70DRAFT_379936 [Aspergillus heteromorphus CBS 117.55]|uniref:Lipocalin-like domain-containing protein n=1 Tax=Aspergillus heteromorphus CBS 117.55 TaxID=1448321 RepID=A0A317WCU7_9EURO|nr:uncharacterized protein BO70DRAFT_379936 [Aspergillus heteromorphus CBS 117.55]PWY81990.1 hypothetical protein BO70DRAFT_379936 [Aspergillus heteromorphus CBS 117.55]